MSRQCRGYANSLPIVAPIITGLSTTSSILGTTTVVTIFGENFRNYSTVYFGTTLINNVTYFSSGQLSFYVPAVSSVGAYPIQVFNDTLASNIVFFTVDNSVGFWNQDPSTGAIYNNNPNGIKVNGPINLNYSPTAITSNSYLGYIITPTTQAVSTKSGFSTSVLNTYLVPQGVWLINGITGANCDVGGENIISIYLTITKNSTNIFNYYNSNIISSLGIPFNLPFVSNGTDTLTITIQVVTTGGNYTPFTPGSQNIYITRIA
jgi:hypothetical protein